MWKFRFISMTSLWARRLMKSPASRFFIQCANQRKHQSSPSLAFLPGIHQWPVNSPHKGPVTRKIFPFDDVIMYRSAAITTTLITWKGIMSVYDSNFPSNYIRQSMIEHAFYSPDLLSTVSLSLLHNFYFNMLIILIFMKIFGFQSHISVNGMAMII